MTAAPTRARRGRRLATDTAPAAPAGPGAAATDDARTAFTLLDHPSAGHPATADMLGLPEVRRAAAVAPVPPHAARAFQRMGELAGRRGLWPDLVRPARAALRAAHGDVDLPPRLLVRVDEYPCASARDAPARFGTDAYRRLHATLRDAGVPYLCAVTPTVPLAPLDPDVDDSRPHDEGERRTLAELAADPGVELAVHGLLHRTRDRRPRRHSEMLGLTPGEVGDMLDRGLEVVGRYAPRPRTFVPPHNRFDAAHWGALASRFDVVSGGPESAMQHGLRPPQWWGDAYWLPSLAPLYGSAVDALAAVERLRAEGGGGPWAVITLHLTWEVGDGGAMEGLTRLAAALGDGLARPWDDLHDGLDRAREAVPA